MSVRPSLAVIAGTVLITVLFFDIDRSDEPFVLAVTTLGPALLVYLVLALRDALTVERYRRLGLLSVAAAGATAGTTELLTSNAPHAPWSLDPIGAVAVAGLLVLTGVLGVSVLLAHPSIGAVVRATLRVEALVVGTVVALTWVAAELVGTLDWYALVVPRALVALAAGLATGDWRTVWASALGAAAAGAGLLVVERLIEPPPATVETFPPATLLLVLSIWLVGPAVSGSTLGVLLRGATASVRAVRQP